MKNKSFFFKSILVFSISMLFISCKNEINKIDSITKDKDMPIEEAYDVEYFLSENAVIKSKMTGSVMKRFEQPETFIEITDGFKLEMYDSLGNINTTITSNYAKQIEATNYLEVKYNVIVTDHIENKILNTEHLILDEKSDKIYSDKFVKITTVDKIIFGEGFESDQTFSKYKILEPKGEIKITRDKK